MTQNFDHILTVCDNSADGYDPPEDARAHCDALLALAPGDFDSLLMVAREFKMAGTSAASRQSSESVQPARHRPSVTAPFG